MGSESKTHFLLTGTWKDRLTCSEAIHLTQQLVAQLDNAQLPFELVVCPPMIALASVASYISHELSLGAQNLVWDDKSSFTGETRARALLEIGCKYVIVGHSERRLYLGETDTMVAQKITTSVNNGLIPIICIGEYLEEHQQGHAERVIREQLNTAITALQGVREPSKFVLAYEPAWAISTSDMNNGMKCEPAEANRRHQTIRETLEKKWGAEFAKEVSIIYGGSVDPQNAADYFCQSDIDGGLVGTASQRNDTFFELINISRTILTKKAIYKDVNKHMQHR